MPWAAGTLCPGDANPHPSSARDAGHRPLANGKRHEEALVPESLSGFPATISWSIRSCYLSLPVLPMDPQAIVAATLLWLWETALTAKFEV